MASWTSEVNRADIAAGVDVKDIDGVDVSAVAVVFYDGEDSEVIKVA
jgi:hypothetical protein